MSGVIQDKRTIGPGATVNNAFEGSVFEFTRVPSIASLGLQADVAGGVMTFQIGNTVLLEESVCPVGTGYPRVPDEFYYNSGALANERMLLRLRNTLGAGNVVFSFILQIVDA